MGPLLTVVMPAYNEEGNIEEAVEDVRRDVLAAVPGSTLIVVDDGSRDGTGAILDRLVAGDPRIRVIHKPNGGHGDALRVGLDACDSEHILLLDSDRQMALEDFAAFWDLARAHDAAFGVRVARDDPAARLVLTRVVRAAIGLLFGVNIRDANVPFKVIRREVWTRARPLIPPETLAPSLFLAIFARKRGLSVVEREVPHRRRRSGVASIRHWKLFRFCCRGLSQMIAFRRKLARGEDPAARPEVIG